MEQVIVFAGLVVALIAHIVFVSIRDRRYQSTIDRLTDKLMAKDYGEYKRLEKHVEREESPKRKPMSFHDDTSIETDD